MSIRCLNNNNKVQTFLKQYPLENEEGWITRPVSLVVPMSQSMLWLCLLYQLQNYTLTTTMAHSPISSTHSFSSSMPCEWGPSRLENQNSKTRAHVKGMEKNKRKHAQNFQSTLGKRSQFVYITETKCKKEKKNHVKKQEHLNPRP
jgi:hypothetical protein